MIGLLKRWGVVVGLLAIGLTITPGLANAGGGSDPFVSSDRTASTSTSTRGGLLGPVRLSNSEVQPGNTSCSAYVSACHQLTYHNGPVVHSVKAYAFFWAPAGYYVPPSYKNEINQFFNDVASQSYSTANGFAAT
jgi:hypothetical protein